MRLGGVAKNYNDVRNDDQTAIVMLESPPEEAAVAAAMLVKPFHPYVILILAVVLPGVGHVALGRQMRGLGFAFFTLLFAFLSWHLSTPETSPIGRMAGGLFVWALSVPDAYRVARLRWERWRHQA